MNHTVSIIVPVYNKIEIVGPCLAKNLEHAHEQCEWIIIDNASDQVTKVGLEAFRKLAIANGHKALLIAEESNTGVAKAWNKGIEHATGAFICVLNNDCVLMPDWDIALKNSTNFGLFSPLIVEPFDFEKEYTLEDFLGNSNGWSQLITKNKNRKRSDFFSGIVLFGPKKTFDDLGPFDEVFWLSMEDIDYEWRAKCKNIPIGIVGCCVGYHFSSLTRKSVQHNELANQTHFERKWGWSYSKLEKIWYNRWIRKIQRKQWKYTQTMSQMSLICTKTHT